VGVRAAPVGVRAAPVVVQAAGEVSEPLAAAPMPGLLAVVRPMAGVLVATVQRPAVAREPMAVRVPGAVQAVLVDVTAVLVDVPAVPLAVLVVPLAVLVAPMPGRAQERAAPAVRRDAPSLAPRDAPRRVPGDVLPGRGERRVPRPARRAGRGLGAGQADPGLTTVPGRRSGRDGETAPSAATERAEPTAATELSRAIGQIAAIGRTGAIGLTAATERAEPTAATAAAAAGLTGGTRATGPSADPTFRRPSRPTTWTPRRGRS
jgi:hypothetical protein